MITIGTRNAARAVRSRWSSAQLTKRFTSIAMAIPSGARRSRSVAADRSATMSFRCSKARPDKQSSLAPGRAARRWMRVTSSGRGGDAEQIASRLRINPEFAGKVYDTIKPGTTVIITDQPVVRSRGKAADPRKLSICTRQRSEIALNSLRTELPLDARAFLRARDSARARWLCARYAEVWPRNAAPNGAARHREPRVGRA